MYDLNLTESYVPAQPDGTLLDLTVGDLLREQAAALPDAVAVTAVAADGTLGQSWSHAELLADAERLALSLATRFEPGELAMWADFRVMEQSAYMGVYCRRWGIPFIDGGTVRLPRLVGEGRALDLILTGRQVMADECERIGLCEYVVPDGEARTRAEELAHQIAQFPQLCARADRRSVKAQHGMNLRDALVQEWDNSSPVLEAEGIEGAGRFSSGDGRHGAGTGSP